MANEKNNTNFTKFGYGIRGSHEKEELKVAQRALVYQGGPLQQSYRFLLNIRGVDAAFITNVSRPSYTINTEEAKLLNWSFSYPIGITWDAVTFSIKEVFEGYNLQTILGLFYKKLTDYSWNTPDFNEAKMEVGRRAGLGNARDLSKLSLKTSLGPITIQSLNSDGEWVEEWTLHGAYITSLKPSQLNYDQDSLTAIDVTVKYDYATLKVKDSSENY